MAALTTAAMHGADAAALAAMIDRLDADAVARLYDTSIAYQLGFRRAEGLGLQDEAVAASPLFRIRRNGESRSAIRLLAIVAPGVLMLNTPLDFITNYLDVRLDLLFVVPDKPLPATIPDHDVAFFAVGEANATMVARLHRLFDLWPRPALNDPGVLPVLARDRLSALLAGVPGICSPPTVMVSRSQLDDLLRDAGDIGDLLPGCSYPVLIRPLGSHAGAGLKKIDGRAALDLLSVVLVCDLVFRNRLRGLPIGRRPLPEVSRRVHRSAGASLPHGLIAELDGSLPECGDGREFRQTRGRGAGHGAFRRDLRSPSPQRLCRSA